MKSSDVLPKDIKHVVYLAEKMINLARENKISGLSAVQCGILMRLFVFKSKKFNQWLIVINPKITTYGLPRPAIETSINTDRLYVPVVRYDSVVLDYFDMLIGFSTISTFTGADAHMIQHMDDYLQGRAIFDQLINPFKI